MKLILLLLLLVCAPVGARDLSIEFGLGQTHFQRIKRDNYWCQDPFPCERDLTSAAWRLGLMKKASPQWSYGVAYLSLGNATVSSMAIPSDDAYGRCAAGDLSSQGCGFGTTRFLVTTRTQGFEFIGKREFNDFYLRGGVYLWFQRTHARIPEHNVDVTFNGTIIAPFLGAGIEHGPFFAELSYYHGMGDGGFPIAKQAWLPMIGLRLPID